MELFEQVGDEPGTQRQRDSRIPEPEPADRTHEVEPAQERRRSHSDVPHGHGPEGAHGPLPLIKTRQGSTHVWEEGLPRGTEGHRPGAVQQRHSQFQLQPLDMGGDDRLSQVEVGSRPGEPTAPHNRLK